MIGVGDTSFAQVIGGTSLTISHDTAGSDRLLLVAITGPASDVITGVTYNGVAMTRSLYKAFGNSSAWIYYLAGPAIGTHDVVISANSSVVIFAEMVTLTGAKQSAPEVTATSQAASPATSLANTLTTLADNAVHFVGFGVDSIGVSSITNGTRINAFAAYSPVITPPGSHTMTANAGGANTWVSAGVSIAPSVPSPAQGIIMI